MQKFQDGNVELFGIANHPLIRLESHVPIPRTPLPFPSPPRDFGAQIQTLPAEFFSVMAELSGFMIIFFTIQCARQLTLISSILPYFPQDGTLCRTNETQNLGKKIQPTSPAQAMDCRMHVSVPTHACESCRSRFL